MELLIQNKRGELNFAYDELMHIKEFKALIRRDRGIEGDSQGRTKLRSYKEIYAIWYMHNWRSPAVQEGLSGDKLFRTAINEADLPNDWSADEIWNNARDRYLDELNKIPDYSFYISALKTFNVAKRTVDRIRGNIETILNSTVTVSDDDMKRLVTNINSLTSLCDEIPKRIKVLNELMEDVKRGEKSLGIARGDVPITESMIP